MFFPSSSPQLLLSFLYIVGVLLRSEGVKGECANACSGHGECSLFDMCICQRNWQAADCSERVCLFGRSWADTPLGDLNSDGVISGPDSVQIQNSFTHPYGTTEGWPESVDSDGVAQSQVLHPNPNTNPNPKPTYHDTDQSQVLSTEHSLFEFICIVFIVLQITHTIYLIYSVSSVLYLSIPSY